MSEVQNVEHPDPCYIIRSLEGASRRLKEGLLVFSTYELADTHMKNMGQEESFYIISLSWDELVERASDTYEAVVIDFVEASITKKVLPLR